MPTQTNDGRWSGSSGIGRFSLAVDKLIAAELEHRQSVAGFWKHS